MTIADLAWGMTLLGCALCLVLIVLLLDWLIYEVRQPGPFFTEDQP